jgi:galactose oxidase
VVTSVPLGINCRITAGVIATTGCSALFDNGKVVKLTATPAAGHSFTGWGNACTGKGTCSVTMTAARTVSAQFLKGPFTIRISAGSGTGTGTVKSQAGLTPAINCVITDGVPAATGCSARYPAYTSLILTATPLPGDQFVGWGAPCSGTGSCAPTVITNRNIPANFAAAGTSSTLGRWTAPFRWPIVGVHLHLLRTGEVFSFGKLGNPRIWKPSTGGFVGVPSTYMMFCSGHTFLPDGRLLVTGGNINHDHGLPYVNILDPTTRTLTRVTSMAQGRWYPTSTTLANGEVLTVGGADENARMVGVPEVWDGTTWRQLSSANLTLPYYPWMFQAPNGSVFYAGPGTESFYLDPTGTGSWSSVIATSSYGLRAAGAAVMYQPGKVLIVGGGGGTETTFPTATAETINLNDLAPTWQSTGSMAFPRRHLNATVLPTGEVLVIGGTGGPGWNDAAGTVHEAEIWNPSTGSWRTLAANTINRIYHSATVLLPDARVLVTGAGAREGAVDELNAEIYSPPYLFQGSRPTLSSAPASLSYRAAFTVGTPNGATIAQVTLVRLGSMTHSFDQNQRFVPLSFEQTLGGLIVTTPDNGSLAPPGYYMLFLVDGNGAPSVAKIVRLQ